MKVVQKLKMIGPFLNHSLKKNRQLYNNMAKVKESKKLTKAEKPNRLSKLADSSAHFAGAQKQDDDDDAMSDVSDNLMETNENENEREATKDIDEIAEGAYDDEVDDEDNIDDNGEIDDEDKDPDQSEDDEEVDDGVEDEGGEEKEAPEDVDERCIYNYADDEADEDEEDHEEFFDDDDKNYDDIVAKEHRITKPFLTKYERVRLLGDRAKQISLGAKPMIKNSEHLTPKKVAELEMQYRVMPLFIERPMPNGKKERWTLDELIF
jgi:DNA-directed RNA polymerases I, II, and III subunit RPABC2